MYLHHELLLVGITARISTGSSGLVYFVKLVYTARGIVLTAFSGRILNRPREREIPMIDWTSGYYEKNAQTREERRRASRCKDWSKRRIEAVN